MKSMFTVLALVSMLAGATAQANFTGAWRGTGVVTDAAGAQKECPIAAFDVEQTATNFNVIQGKVECAMAGGYEIPSVNLTIHNGGLFYSFFRIGSIADAYFTAKFASNEHGNNVFEGWIVDANTLRYRHVVTKGGVTTTVDATMTR